MIGGLFLYLNVIFSRVSFSKNALCLELLGGYWTKLFLIHKDSNHPPSIMKNFLKSIQIRLSNKSMNEKTFKELARPYNVTRKEIGHNYILKYKPNHTRQENSRANPISEE